MLQRSLFMKCVCMSAVFFPLGFWAQAQTEQIISQKNRTYAPGAVTLKKGESLKIINDDIFLHHAFIKSEAINFDSGSMEEGEMARVTFNKPGEYQLLCAIHPKMKLNITVE